MVFFVGWPFNESPILFWGLYYGPGLLETPVSLKGEVLGFQNLVLQGLLKPKALKCEVFGPVDVQGIGGWSLRKGNLPRLIRTIKLQLDH